MFIGRHALTQVADDSYFIDRESTHFRYILNYLRDGDKVKRRVKRFKIAAYVTGVSDQSDIMSHRQQLLNNEAIRASMIDQDMIFGNR